MVAVSCKRCVNAFRCSGDTCIHAHPLVLPDLVQALEHVLVEQQVALAEELQGHVLQCVKDQNANHVIQKIIERVSPSRIDFIPKAFEGQVFQLAAHCYSCRVLQRIFEHCDGSQSRPLLEELHRHTKQLMQDQYGNYVVQWVLQRGSRADKDAVVAVAKGQILALSRHKFASNVVEGIIRAASAQDKQDFIEEILAARPVNEGAAAPGPRGAQQPPTGPAADAQQTSAAVIMMKDQFANYVLQRFLEVAQGEQRARLVATVRPQLISMRRYSSGYAKHLAASESSFLFSFAVIVRASEPCSCSDILVILHASPRLASSSSRETARRTQPSKRDRAHAKKFRRDSRTASAEWNYGYGYGGGGGVNGVG